jgi:hypothetical protein
MPYCIYTDKDIANEAGNPDHVIPLSLGGANGFRVFSDKHFNSTVGSNVDGAIANDPLVEFARRNADARGHSKRNPPRGGGSHQFRDALYNLRGALTPLRSGTHEKGACLAARS